MGHESAAAAEWDGVDPLTRWLRTRVLRAVARRAAVEVVVITAAGVVVLWRLGRLDGPRDLVWVAVVIVAAQLVVALHLALTLLTSPLSPRYLRGYRDDDLSLEVVHPAQLDGGPAADIDGDAPSSGEQRRGELVALGLQWTGTVRARSGNPSLVYDVVVSPDRTVTAMVGRLTGSVAVSSRLADGRILHTAALLTPPRRLLVCNVIDDDDVIELLEAHRAVGERCRSMGCPPCADGPVVAVEAWRAERIAYRELGVAGSWLSLRRRGSWLRLLTAVDRGELLRRSLSARPASRPSAPEPGHRPPSGSRSDAASVAAPAAPTPDLSPAR